MAIPRAAGGTEPGIPHYPLAIDGSGIEAKSGRRYDTIDPFLGSAWATAAGGDAADVDLAVPAAWRALAGPWGKLGEMRGQLASIPEWFYCFYFAGLADKLQGPSLTGGTRDPFTLA